MTKNEVKDFIEEHKMHIAMAVGAVTGIAVWAITKDKPSNCIDIAKPELITGKWVSLGRAIKGKYAGAVYGVVDDVNVTDLGNFGDALATIDGISPNEPIKIIFGTARSFK